MRGDWVPAVVGEPDTPQPDSPTADLFSLETLVSAVEGATELPEAVALVVAWLGDDDAHPAVAAALRCRPGPTAALITRLGSRRGMKRHADAVQRTLRRLAREQAATARTTASEADPDERDLREVLDHTELPSGLHTPPGWLLSVAGIQTEQVDRDGEARLVDVAPRPLVVTARFKDIADGATSLRLEWPTSTGWAHRVVPRGTAMDSRSLVSLAAWDAPVHSDNARHLVRYLSDFEATNRDALPEALVSTTMGWPRRCCRKGCSARRCRRDCPCAP